VEKVPYTIKPIKLSTMMATIMYYIVHLFAVTNSYEFL
jgi:hypothetical protein